MRLLYPDDPLDQRSPDALFIHEYTLARARGLATSIFSFEDFERGRFEPKPRLVTNERVLYRGWMLNPEAYERLAQATATAGAQMIVSPAIYRSAHHLPFWYPLVKGLTAETLVFAENADFSAELRETNWPGYFVKDYVKSLNTGAGSLVSAPEDVARVVAQLKKYRGEVEGGVCVRRKEEYTPGSERRHFVAAGQVFAHESEAPSIVAACATLIPSPFFSVDTAIRIDGVTRIIEIGDGQVSDRKEWSPERLVDVLQYLSRSGASIQ